MDLVKLLNRYPVTGGTCLLAVVASVAFWCGFSIDRLTVDYHVWSGQLWRPLTTTLPHLNFVHLFFDVYWTWKFGSRIEEVFGTWRTLGLFAFLAAGASLSEYDFAGNCVGLSGVAYGLFGFVWVLSSRDPRFAGSVDQQTVVLMIAWFFLCIILTAKDVMRIGNFAHGGGLLLGLLCGWLVSRRYDRNPWICGAVAASVLALLAMLGTVARPYVNYTEFAGREYFDMGNDAISAGRNEEAVHCYRLALQRQGDWRIWFNMGLAYQKLDRWKDAVDAFQKAFELERNEPDIQMALAYAKAKLAE